MGNRMLKRIALLLLCMSAWVAAANLVKPSKSFEASGIVEDMTLAEGKLLVGTDTGKLQIFSLNDFQKIDEVQLPKIKDFMGDVIDTKVFSVDGSGGRELLLSDSGEGGYSALWLYEKGKLRKIFGAEAQKTVIKARFVDDDHILLGYLSDEVGLYDLRSRKELYHRQLEPSKFSDFALDEGKKRAVFGCESGKLTLIDVATGKTLASKERLHLDNVLSVAFRHGWAVAGSQDRRGSYWHVDGTESGYFEGSFPVYAVGLSPSAKIAAYTMDENRDIRLYDLASQSLVARLQGLPSRPEKILFLDGHRILGASQDNRILLWNLKK